MLVILQVKFLFECLNLEKKRQKKKQPFSNKHHSYPQAGKLSKKQDKMLTQVVFQSYLPAKDAELTERFQTKLHGGTGKGARTGEGNEPIGKDHSDFLHSLYYQHLLSFYF